MTAAPRPIPGLGAGKTRVPMTDKPPRQDPKLQADTVAMPAPVAEPEGRIEPTLSAAAVPAPDPEAESPSLAEQPATATFHTRPIHPARPRVSGRPLAWSGFLLGALALVAAIGLALLLWRFAGTTQPIASGPALGTGDLVEMETLLDQLGFPPGKLDGVVDADSIAAIREFQETAGLPVDGVPSSALLEELRAALSELSGG
jgi:hypothetical protein